MRWLNSAFLGHHGSGMPASVGRMAPPIALPFDRLRQWVLEWTGRRTGKVAFVESTMAACDAALLSLAADQDMHLYTSSAHPTISHSVAVAAEIVGHMRGRPTLIREVSLRNLPLRSGAAVADAIADRVERSAKMRPSVLVLEHVTYDSGLRLPIDAIIARLNARARNVRIIVDGAQAVGLWRPQHDGFAAYLGCFHKFMGGPAATAFVVIDEALARRLPAHVKVMCDVSGASAARCLHTVDLAKWSMTEQVVRTHNAIAELGDRLSRIEVFNRALDAALAPAAVSLGADHDPHLRSHISSVTFAGRRAAATAVAELARNGYAVQQCGRLVRVAAGHGACPAWATEVGAILRRLSGNG
jgi:selenocysteine lyase/cysteine desulfurase